MALMQSLRRSLRLAPQTTRPATLTAAAPVAVAADVTGGAEIAIAPSDPLLAYLQGSSGPVDVDRLELESPALAELRAAGIRLVVPLVTSGELIGALYLGPRLSDQEYSTDDRRLLATLAAQAAPAIRVAQLVQEQAAEIQVRERIEQEMRLATLIQQQFLPRKLPDLPDWQVAAYYGPARAVGGDFYDFIPLPDGRIGVVVGDVTDKGVPAALVMARTQSILRGEAPRLISPSKVLERANEILVDEMPDKMFVTCLYAVIDPTAGSIVFANAGHNLPYVRTADGVIELRATGMPLGLLPGMPYDEVEATIAPGQDLLLYSDGLVEAHDPGGKMYGFPRLREQMGRAGSGSELLDRLLEDLHDFAGRSWEQEDDITLVTLRRSGGTAEQSAVAEGRPGARAPYETFEAHGADTNGTTGGGDVVVQAGEVAVATETAGDRVLATFAVPGAAGNERLAMNRVAEAVAGVGLEPARLERLKTAVSEAAMNAIEYGSGSSPDVPVDIAVALVGGSLTVRITDRALGGPIPDAEEPDIEAKLAGLQKPRGWGLFLIRSMVDDVEVSSGDDGQTVTLTMHLGGGDDGRRTADGTR
jgi:serine phosphatase RsbU (regulator of sigma subunit)/anti-sigma regulatory factor (Ser/Thr protein kinase)